MFIFVAYTTKCKTCGCGEETKSDSFELKSRYGDCKITKDEFLELDAFQQHDLILGIVQEREECSSIKVSAILNWKV